MITWEQVGVPNKKLERLPLPAQLFPIVALISMEKKKIVNQLMVIVP